MNWQVKIEKINNLVKSYDKTRLIAGEGPLMNDLVTIADQDFEWLTTNINTCNIYNNDFSIKTN